MLSDADLRAAYERETGKKATRDDVMGRIEETEGFLAWLKEKAAAYMEATEIMQRRKIYPTYSPHYRAWCAVYDIPGPAGPIQKMAIGSVADRIGHPEAHTYWPTPFDAIVAADKFMRENLDPKESPNAVAR